MKSSKLRSITTTLSKIAEIIAWLISGILAIFLIVFLAMKDKITEVLQNSTDIDIFVSTNDNNYIPAVVIIILSGIILSSLMALMFRNVNLVFKNTNTGSPFSLSNVKRVRQIGYLALSIPAIELITNLFLSIFTNELNYTIDLNEIIFGLIILCLAQYFAYGTSLENDVNGLV